MAAPGLGHCHDLVVLGTCPVPYSDDLVHLSLLCALAGITPSISMKQQERDFTALENIISSRRWLVCGVGLVTVWGYPILLATLNTQCSKTDSGWPSSGSFPYLRGSVKFNIERFHPEIVDHIFLQAQEHKVLSL